MRPFGPMMIGVVALGVLAGAKCDDGNPAQRCAFRGSKNTNGIPSSASPAHSK